MMDKASKEVFDALSLGAVIATLIGWLPAIASVLSILWLLIRIWESPTVQKLWLRLCKPPDCDPPSGMLDMQ